MKTKVFDMKKVISPQQLIEIATLLQKGETVAFPTETVYGLGADATNETAVEKIFKAKGRPSDNPLIVHVATKAHLFSLVKDPPDYVAALVDKFSPGPITYVLRDAGKVTSAVTASLNTVGVRIPSHPIALAILRETALPIAAPSANRSGRPSPTEASHVAEDLTGKIPAIVDGGETDVGIESTVVDCTGSTPLILRPGAITVEDITKVVGTCDVLNGEKTTQSPKSPGLKYIHYAPEVPLILVDRAKVAHIVAKYKEKNKKIALLYGTEAFPSITVKNKQRIGRDERDIARRLYRLLRSYNKSEVDVIICEYPTFIKDAAIIDRLKRAATEIII